VIQLPREATSLGFRDLPAIEQATLILEYKWNTVYPAPLLPSYDDLARQ
jgi:hypothetical protein